MNGKKLNMMTVTAFAVLSCLAGTSYSQASNLTSGDFIGDFAITQQLVTGNQNGTCDFSDEELNPRERLFHKAICTWHTQARSQDPALLDDNIKRLQSLQTQGLPGVQQALASLIEGLSHCQKARTQQYRAQTDASARASFCKARSDAIATFANIPWRFARFYYAEGTSMGAQDLIQAMTSCYAEAEPLNPGFDSDCGIYTGTSAETQAELIEDQYAIVESRYFLGSSPISAMFKEKKDLAEATRARAEVKRDQLLEKAAEVDAALYKAQVAFYDHVKDPNKKDSPLDQVIKNYKDAYATGKAILERYQQWQDGLLVQKNPDGTSDDLSLRLVGPTDTLSSDEILRSEGDKFNGERGLHQLVAKLKSKLEQHQSGNAAFGETARQLCRIYYCQFAVAIETGGFDFFSPACRHPDLFEKNPLCQRSAPSLTISGASKPVADFCQENDFDAKFTAIGLSYQDANSCFETDTP